MKRYILAGLLLTMVFLVACMPTSKVQPVDELAEPVLLSGSSVPYYEFNQALYDQAIADNKKIFLMWYATWCPSCRAEQKIAQPFFDTLQRDDVVAFRVNFKDRDTDANEQAITKKFQVTSQTTKVFIVDGEKVYKTPQHFSNAAQYQEYFNLYFGEE